MTSDFPATCDIAIVGAGAAGLATAIFIRRLNPQLHVVILEGARRPGAKILVSGGTRCNVTNASVDETDFAGGKPTIVRRILRAFPVADTIAFFGSIGVRLHEEAGGKLFPDTNRARDVLDALLRETDRVGAQLVPASRVRAVNRDAGGFLIESERGYLRARNVVMATGGLSLPKSGSDGAGLQFARALGHTIVLPTPALVPLVLAEGGIHRQLAGISHDVELTVWINRAKAQNAKGSLLWTHTGISGPVALDISRYWARANAEGKPVALTANFIGGRSFDAADADLQRAVHDRPKAPVRSAVASLLPAAVADALLESLGIARDQPLGQLPRDARRRLVHALVEWPLDVTGTRGYNYAEVTAGGVALDEIDPATMASRVCPGLWLVGEILDVDGRIGGFNFQWAWATARVAAIALSSGRTESPA